MFNGIQRPMGVKTEWEL